MASLEKAFTRFRRTGDPKALADVFDATAPELFRVAMHLLGDPHLAEDVVQTSYLVAIEERDSFKGKSSVFTWLMGILINRVRETRRTADRQPDPDRIPTRKESGPHQIAEARELSREVSDAIAKLPERYQPVLNLHLAHGLLPHEIALALVRPPGTVRAQLCRGLTRLRRALPKGLSGVLAASAVSTRGLATIRTEVLQAAAKTRVIAPAVAGGGLLIMKAKSIAVSAALVAGIALLWSVWGVPRSELPFDTATAQPAPLQGDIPLTDVATEAPAGGLQREAVQPPDKECPGRSPRCVRVKF